MRKYHVLHNPKARKKPARRTRRKNPNWESVVYWSVPTVARYYPGMGGYGEEYAYFETEDLANRFFESVWGPSMAAGDRMPWERYGKGAPKPIEQVSLVETEGELYTGFGDKVSVKDSAYVAEVEERNRQTREEWKNPKRKATKRKATKKRTSRRRKNPDPELAVPEVGETVEVPLASHPEYTLQVTGKKTPKKYIATLGEDSYYAKIVGPDGEVIGKARGTSGEFGPYESPADANIAANFLGGMLIGAEDVLEANPAKRKRLASNARRHFAKPNGIFSEGRELLGLGGPQLEHGDEAGLSKADVSAAQQIVGLPSDRKASYRLGYYFGILRGMDTCGYTPTKWLERRRFRKELQNTIIKSVNDLQKAVISPDEAQRRIRMTT